MNLELAQCRIRSWCPDDATALQRHADNRNVWLNLRDIFPHPYTLANAHSFIEFAGRQEPETNFAIALGSEAIGGIGLNLGADVHRRTAELGYWLAEAFWGRGIMTEAVRALVPWAFDFLPLVRVYAEPFASNLASIRVLENAGFLREGRLRANVFKDGQVLDTLLYARVQHPGEQP